MPLFSASRQHQHQHQHHACSRSREAGDDASIDASTRVAPTAASPSPTSPSPSTSSTGPPSPLHLLSPPLQAASFHDTHPSSSSSTLNKNRRPSSSSSSATSSIKRRTSRFLFTSSPKPPPVNPSPTGSKSSSAETTATQSSLGAISSTSSSYPSSNSGGDRPEGAASPTSPLTPPLFDAPASVRKPSSEAAALHVHDATDHSVPPPGSKPSAFKRVLRASGLVRGQETTTTTTNTATTHHRHLDNRLPPASLSASPRHVSSASATGSTNIGSSHTHLSPGSDDTALDSQEAHIHTNENSRVQRRRSSPSLNFGAVPRGRSGSGPEQQREVGVVLDQGTALHHQPMTSSDMKRPLAAVDPSTSHLHQNDQVAENTDNLNTLPANLANQCLTNLGLPFLLFDKDENLVYMNDAAREVVPGLASSSSSLYDLEAGLKDDRHGHAASASGNVTGTNAPRRSQRRKYDDTHSHPTSSNASTSSFSRSSNIKIQASDIYNHSAFDDIGFATSKFTRDPSTTKPFSLSKTLEERGLVGQSYVDSSTLPPSTIPTSASGAAQATALPLTPPVKRQDSRLSLKSTSTAGAIGPGNATGVSAAYSGNPGSTNSRPSRTRTSTDGWLGENMINQCQPFLRMNGSDGKTWWRSNISRIEAPVQANVKTASSLGQQSSVYYAVLMFQPVVHEIVDIVPCDDVSSIRSLSSAVNSRPALNRTPSDPPHVPGDLASLTQKIEDEAQATAAAAIPAEFYKAAVECMPQILFTSGRDGIITYLNPQWYSYTGWDMKKPSREMWADVFHPSDVGVAVEKYSEAIRSGSNVHLQYRVKNKDGDFRWMIARGRCIRDDTDKITGFVCTLTDGQDLIDAQEKAVQTQQYVSTVLQASAITLIVVDTTRKVVMFEGYTEALDKLGVTSEEAMGRLLEDAWPDLECAEQAQAMLAQQDNSETLKEKEFATTVGPSHFRYRLVPLYEAKAADISPIYDEAGTTAPRAKLTGLAIVCTDISAMVRAEMALVQSQKEREELAAREEAAREASRLKTIFVTSLSHEIRTPISGMLGISELLLGDETLSAKHQSLVKKQLHAGEVLLQLVSMVLDLGKMEANKLELEKEPFLLSDLMKDLDIFASLADAKDIYFERILDVGQDCCLVGDRLRLAQVLSNFISNSVKFTSHGGITLRVESEERENDSLMTFQLEDTGTGIDKETLPHLFKPFHQGNVTIARRFGGSGLGLSIAKTLTELMGGSVSLESIIGVGTTVRLQIPLSKPIRPLYKSTSRKSTDYSLQRLSPDTVAPPQAQLADRRQDVSILIAEDNSLLQEIYVSLVRKMGFGKVRVVEDGLQAIEQIEKDLPHVVLMDIEMPRMNGPDAVRHLRSHENVAIRGVKIIALTANAVSGDKERFLAMGMDMYLSKPVRASKLEEVIVECLQGM